MEDVRFGETVEENAERLRKPAYLGYDPATEAYCGACQNIFPIGKVHLCANPAVRYEPPTLRDQFAMAALNAIDRPGKFFSDLASEAYRLADAMMEARKPK